MNNNTKDAIYKLQQKINELVEELDKRDLDSQTKIDYASVYFNAYKFFKIQDYEHNIEVMNKDVKNRKFNKEK